MALLSKSFNTALTTDSEDVKIYSGETDKPWGFMGCCISWTYPLCPGQLT